MITMAEKEYIEREALIEEAKHNKAVCQAIADIVDVKDIINNTPVADVAPIRHGHWIEEYDCGYTTPHCSECGETALTKEETSYDYVYSSYCPRCGAKMGGEGE